MTPTTPDSPTVTARPGTPSAIVLQGPSLIGQVASTVDVSIKVVDSVGVGVPSIVVDFVVTSGGGAVFAPAVETAQAGIASEQWTLGTVASPQTLEARWISPATGAAVVLGVLSVTPTPGPLANLSFGPLGNQTISALVGTTLSVAGLVKLFGGLYARDRYGNAVDTTGAAYSTSGPATLSGSSVNTSNAGMSAFIASLEGKTATDSIAIVDDMRLHQWSFSYTCSDELNSVLGNQPGDSMVVQAVSTGATYLTPTPATAYEQGLTLGIAGTRTVYAPVSSPTVTAILDTLRIGERPDTLGVESTYSVATGLGIIGANSNFGRTMPGVLTFVGTSACGSNEWAVTGPVVMKALSP